MARTSAKLYRLDPTQLTMVRNQFAIDLRKQYNRIAKDAVELVVTEDALGLKTLVTNARWQFLSSDQKLEAFKGWLGKELNQTTGSFNSELLWKQFIERGHQRGVTRAYQELKAAGTSFDRMSRFIGGRDQFLSSLYSQPVTVQKVKVLAARALTDLEGVTAKMATKMSLVLLNGLVELKTPRQIADDLVREVGIGEKQAIGIANTELTRAHAEGQLDAMEELGSDEVEAAVEWETFDGGGCPLCEALNGVVLKVDEARGLLPRHPHCRCRWKIATKKTGDQITSKVRILGAIKKSARLGKDSFDLGVQISKKRPVLNMSKFFTP